MTNFEKKQSLGTFVHAGKTAFLMGIHILDNPYKEQPFKNLWEKGFYSEKNKQFKTNRFKKLPKFVDKSTTL